MIIKAALMPVEVRSKIVLCSQNVDACLNTLYTKEFDPIFNCSRFKKLEKCYHSKSKTNSNTFLNKW